MSPPEPDPHGIPAAPRIAALNRPATVFREMARAFVIPIAIVAMLRLAFLLVQAV